MTNKEIDKLLTMLDSKTLNEVKEFLLKQKVKNINDLRQRTFENYMCNTRKNFHWGNPNGTVIFEDTNDITFSNGISLYILNKGLVDIKSSRIINHMNNTAIKPKHRINKIDETKKLELLEILENFKIDLRQLQYTQSVNNVITRLTSYIYYPKEIDFDFKTEELNTADILLDKPELRMSTEHPLLYGENDNGKVYILGHIKHEQ